MGDTHSSSGKWQSIRPWDPRLSLSIREITSVSTTFILSSLSSHTNLSFILDGEDEDSQPLEDVSDHSPNPQIVTDAQTKGLSVKVNGTAWRRVLARIDDDVNVTIEAMTAGYDAKRMKWFGPVVVMKPVTNEMLNYVDVDDSDLPDIQGFFTLGN